MPAQQAPLLPSYVEALQRLSGDGVDAEHWLLEAESCIDFLSANVRSEWVVVYASLAHVLIHGILAPLKRLKPPNWSDLDGDFAEPDRVCCIEHVMGGGRPDRVSLAPAFSEHNATLKRGEKLVFFRSWAGSDNTPGEISQRLLHALEAHFVEEKNAYCRVDELGDIEEVIKITEILAEQKGWSTRIVAVKARDLYEYARLSGMGFVFYFDFTRYDSRSFNGWSGQKRFDRTDQQLHYNGGVQPGAGSYVNGRLVFAPPVTKREIVRRHKELWKPRNPQYAKFKIVELRTGMQVEASCDPTKTSNYFQRESTLPLEMSPAFFNAEVLSKYKSDKKKYTLEERSVSCRGAWSLSTYDVNEAGQIHTYLRYLRLLPYAEQLYWQSFNEWPKGPISRRAFRTDFEGEWSTDYEPIGALKLKVARLDKAAPDWWRARGEALARAVQYPVTKSEDEWIESILALDQFVVEGFQEKRLRQLATLLGRDPEPEWRALKLLEECLLAKGVANADAEEAVQSLRNIHELRHLKGHVAARKKADEARRALKAYGSFKAHFGMLAQGSDEALGAVLTAFRFHE